MLRSKRSKIFLGVFIIIVIVGFVAAHNLSGQDQGTINNNPATNLTDEEKQTQDSPLTYSGKYLSFTYPSTYRVSPAATSGTYVEVVNLISKTTNENQISVGVEPETLATDTGISFRKQNPSIYKLITSTSSIVEFDGNTSQGYEQDYFIQHGPYVASLVLTTLAQSSAGNDLNQVLNSLKWSD